MKQPTVPAYAPTNDLAFLQNLEHYRQFDEPLVQAALAKFARHTWYLSQELVPHCLLEAWQRKKNRRWQTSFPALPEKQLVRGLVQGLEGHVCLLFLLLLLRLTLQRS